MPAGIRVAGAARQASFVGSVDDNIIRGTLFSVCEDDGRRLDGRWNVERKRGVDQH
jgi:hypothetical protein